MNIKLTKPFTSGGEVDSWDVKQMKKTLNRLGYYMPLEKTGITGIPDAAVFNALKQFQKDHGLSPTGGVRDGDATVKKLNEEAAKIPDGRYIWRTVEDDRVRNKHAQYNRAVRDWADDPDPGQEFNCRCWAEPVTAAQQKTQEPKKKKCFDSMPWEEEAVKDIKDYEGDGFDYPYLDSEGIITIGIGININDRTVFFSLPWLLDNDTGPRAGREQIEEGYRILLPLTGGQKRAPAKEKQRAGKFENKTRLRLSQTVLQKLFHDRYETAKKELIANINKSQNQDLFKCFPPDAKIALIDLQFNMGSTRFNPTTWDDLFAAARARDWVVAAKESSRKQVSAERNQKTFKRFMSAADMEWEEPNKN